MAMTVSTHHRHERAKATDVSDNQAARSARPGCGARGRWRGLAELRSDAPSRRLAARTASGRAAAHRHTQRPGLTKHTRHPEHPWGHKQHEKTGL